MTNRITDTSVENIQTPPDRPLLPVVSATRVWGWRCPDCSAFQIAKKSTTYEESCWKCGKKFTVEIRT